VSADLAARTESGGSRSEKGGDHGIDHADGSRRLRVRRRRNIRSFDSCANARTGADTHAGSDPGADAHPYANTHTGSDPDPRTNAHTDSDPCADAHADAWGRLREFFARAANSD
jgi:hypothetical protein